MSDMDYLPRTMDVHLLLKVIRREATPAEEEYVDAWLAESDDHKEEYASLVLLWQRTGQVAVPEPTDPAVQWELVRGRLRRRGYPGVVRPVPRPAASWNGWSVWWRRHAPRVGMSAAAVAAIVGLTAGVLWLADQRLPRRPSTPDLTAELPPPREVVTANGRRATVPLPDGSIVLLNAASTLRIPATFGPSDRHVELEGEAYFQVVGDSLNPFRVQTGATFTEVRGTEFNVRFRKHRLSVVVSLGNVRVSSPGSGVSVEVRHGELLTAAAGGELSRPRRVNVQAYTAWRENRLSFVRTPLEEVLEEIQAVYDLKVDMRARRSRGRTLTGSFDAEAVDDVLSHIAIAMDVSIRRDGRTVVVEDHER